jgi:hypothetical protein
MDERLWFETLLFLVGPTLGYGNGKIVEIEICKDSYAKYEGAGCVLVSALNHLPDNH